MNRNQNISAKLGQPIYTYDSHEGGALKKHPVDVFSERASLTRWLLTMPHLSSMVWDYKDELVSAGNGTVTSYYNYDLEGNRSRKVVEKPGGIREERYYFGGYEVYRKFISNSLDKERETVHIMDDRERFVIIDTLTVENGVTLTTPVATIRYQYSNHLGSACLELDGSAAIISYEEYHPFGTTSYRSGRSEAEVSLKRYKYVGKERDEETGLYYYGARYYAAWIARFVSVDPLQHKYPHYTPYQYAGNKPISYIDLDGLEEAKKDTNIQLDDQAYYEQLFTNKETECLTIIFEELNKSETFRNIMATLNNSENSYKIINGVITRNLVSGQFSGQYARLAEWPSEIDENEYEEFIIPEQYIGGSILLSFNIFDPKYLDSKDVIQKMFVRVLEEFVHAGQYEYYVNKYGTLNGNNEVVNTEFEAKIIVGMILEEIGVGDYYYLEGDLLPNEYGSEMNNNFIFNIETYFGKMLQWRSDEKTDKEYRDKPYNYDLPEFLFQFIKN